jgi:predicted SAM-dependent methyltransferase
VQRLNVGCGTVQPAGWQNLDIVDHGQEFVVDVREGLPFPDDFADYAVANHVLSDWTFHELPGALKELHRVLRPGGVLRVLVPDLEAAVIAYDVGKVSWFPQGDDLTNIDERFCTFVTWFGTVGSVFTPKYLGLLLERAGFDWQRRPIGVTSDINPPEITSLDGDRTTSLIMEGRK